LVEPKQTVDGVASFDYETGNLPRLLENPCFF